MIIFLTTDRLKYTHKDVTETASGRIDIRVRSYSTLYADNAVATATYIFTDFDCLSGPDLYRVGILFRRLKAMGLRVLNNPAQYYSRFGLLRLLFHAGINNFNAYRVEERRMPRK